MGLPEINVSFQSRAETAVQRSENGIVAVILEDTTKTDTSYSYAYEADISTADWTAGNREYLNLVFRGAPRLVIVERIQSSTGYSDALARLKNKKWNWLTVPGIATSIGTVKTVAEWITAQRAAGKTFKAVLACTEAEQNPNDAGIVDFATDNVTVGTKTFSAHEYCARIAGTLAGLSMTESATYHVLPEVESIDESTTPDEDIDGGKMILINDGEKIKIASGVNSLHILEDGQSEEMKSIKIVEGMDLIRDDIRDTFEENYIGINNSYDNKCIFIGAVNEYFDGLVRQGVLYDQYDNLCEIDIAAQRDYLAQKYSVDDMTDEEIKVAKTGKYIFARADIQFTEAIENLEFEIMMS